MPHVSMKLWPGRSEKQKSELAAAIARDVCQILHTGDASVSVSTEEVGPEEWMERVYRPEITAKPDTVYKKPGYESV